MNRCYLSLGSNQKSPERQLRSALRSLARLPQTQVKNNSSFYWSKAWGLEMQQDFCNLVVEIITRLPPHLLLKECQDIEREHGRVRKRRWGPRTLDIDIILYSNRSINTAKLKIPHPQMKFREFVLKPLFELNPNMTSV